LKVYRLKPGNKVEGAGLSPAPFCNQDPKLGEAMRLTENLKISTKLFFSFGTVLTLFLGFSILSYINAGRIGTNASLVKEQRFSHAIQAIELVNLADKVNNLLVSAAETMRSDPLRHADTAVVAYREALGKFLALDLSPDVEQSARLLNEGFEIMFDSGKAMANRAISQDLIGMVQARQRFIQDQQVFQGKAEVLKNTAAEALYEGLEEIDLLARHTGLIGLVVSLLTFGAAVFLAAAITRSITQPLAKVIGGLSSGATQVADSANQIAAGGQELAEGASEQAASIEEISASLEEISSMARQNVNNAGQADGLVRDVNLIVKRASDSMAELTTSMQEITRSSEQTSKIIKTIDDIAFQTNLLALNAAVEAARAGQAGAGFAVVADQVRTLAGRAAEAAKNTADLIEDTVKRVHDGSKLVARTSSAFNEVSDSAAKATELVGDIAAATSQQADGISQLNTAISEIDNVVQHTVANAEESAAAAEQLSGMAADMEGYVYDLLPMVGNDATSFQITSKRTRSARTRLPKTQAARAEALSFSEDAQFNTRVPKTIRRPVLKETA
jgi:X-X-X-Leu-X-X-Gly heptad repeat protein